MTLCSNKNKAIAHIIKNKYGITDEEYRGILFDNFGTRSSVNLEEEECDEFIHILNYKYNQDYKHGYDRGVKEYMSQLDIETQFKIAIKNKYNREVTELELQMFNTIDYIDKTNLIKSLI